MPARPAPCSPAPHSLSLPAQFFSSEPPRCSPLPFKSQAFVLLQWKQWCVISGVSQISFQCWAWNSLLSTEPFCIFWDKILSGHRVTQGGLQLGALVPQPPAGSMPGMRVCASLPTARSFPVSTDGLLLAFEVAKARVNTFNLIIEHWIFYLLLPFVSK